MTPNKNTPEDWPLPPLLGEPEPREIHDIHQAILTRELEEPREGLEPAPWWVWAVSVTVLFAMGFYLGRYFVAFTPEAHLLEQGAAVVQAASASAEQVDGAGIYLAVCLPCHQAGGTGMEGKYPPLAGSEWVAKDPAVLARILINGLTGPVQVKGKTYANEMPALGPQLSDEEIAAVLTYIRSSFGNQAPPVSKDAVAKARAASTGQPAWTAAKLRTLEAK